MNPNARSRRRLVGLAAATPLLRRSLASVPAAIVAAPSRAAVPVAAVVGQPAPPLSLPDAGGRRVALADLRGRIVVVEWVNPFCPFVRKHYDSRNLPSLQARAAKDGVAWLAVQSTHPGHPEHLSGPELARRLRDAGATVTAVLMDLDGQAGRAWGARTTPQMFVIDAGGRLVYAGAIDDRRSTSADDIPLARNHVAAALDDLRAGRPVGTPASVPYGCSVKYRD